MLRKLWLSLMMLCASGLLLVTSSAGAPAPAAASSPGGSVPRPRAAPAAPADTPYSLVPSGVTAFTLADPVVYGYNLPACTQNIHGPSAPAANLYETLQRLPTYGGLTRQLWQHPVNAICPAGQDVLSNLVSDGSYLYWMSSVHNGLVKLSVDANLGDKPTVVSKAVSGQAEIVLAQGALFVLTRPSSGPTQLWTINLGTGAGSKLENTGAGSFDFKTDNGYLYWIDSGYSLHEWDLHYAQDNGTLLNNVTGYLPLGRIVYIAQGDKIIEYDNGGNPNVTVYTSSDATNTVYDLAYDGGSLFWFEDHPIPCGSLCFEPHNDLLYRAGDDGSNPTKIYLYSAGLNPQASSLAADAGFLFWLENGGIQRLPENAAALPQVNLVADSVEVTQGIQDTTNDVPIIQGRDTYVRFYVHSTGAAVSGVSAYLYLVGGDGNPLAGPLLPVNPVGEQITVQPAPDRNNLNDSFLFELPYSWDTGAIHLKAVLNPAQDPLEPNYGDNTVMTGPMLFFISPRLTVYYIDWGYTINSVLYFPRYVKDMIQNWSWMQRTYPLASAPGMLTDPSPGFRPNLWTIIDGGLGARVNQTASGCSDNSCASAYTNSLEAALRTEDGIPANDSIYGMISDAAGFFPRGQECCGPRTSSGPAGSSTWGWDGDGSYADWYGGHEIGHTVGRSHPSSSAMLCGNSASDPSYPHPNGQIGENNGNLEGFDVGDTSLGLPLAVYPGAKWHDVMTYCNNQWISDYTYEGIYYYVLANPSPTVPAAAPSQPAPAGALRAPALTGNWLAVYGNLITNATGAILTHVPGFQASATSAVLTRVRHLSAVATIPPLVSGPYSLELYGASNNQLASYPFTPQPASNDHPNWLSFTQVITDVPGATQLRVVQLSGSLTLATQAIPATGPTISNVHLVGAPNPVSGTVTLQWTAGDTAGNPLTFDLFYSRDGGASLQPLMVGVSGAGAAIDTSPLGGSGTALLRVVASDGVNTAQADSAPFTMADKPPQPMILTPADGAQRHYGQLVNFSGLALDAQDLSVDPSKLVWSDQDGSLGTGALLSLSNLPVGADVITLKATDSAGQKASTSLTVYVDDNLRLPGPTLSVGPQQFNWMFATSASPVQTDTLRIDNVGSGILTPTVTTDVPWLRLSLSSGPTPLRVKLTADPAGLPNNSTRTGHVFINVPASGGGPAQQVVVPVGLEVAFNFINPPLETRSLYLPLIAR